MLNNTSSLLNISPFSHTTTEAIILYLPLWAFILLGVYALNCVLYRVATFEDCSEAAEDLGREIEVAKVRLTERGFKL